MDASDISVPTIGIVVVVSRNAASIVERGGFGPDLCEPDDVADRLFQGRRAVVVLTIGTIVATRSLVALAKQAAVPITALLDESTLSGANCVQADRTLSNAGIRTAVVVPPDEPVVSIAPAFDRRNLSGPFDVIGDIHGCIEELESLLGLLGYRHDGSWTHERGRTVVFVGDLTDRGPDSPAVLELVLGLHEAGIAMMVLGNHDDKLLRHLGGANVKAAHGLALTIEQLERHADGEVLSARARALLTGLPDHLLLDDGRLVVAHAGLRAELHGKVSKRVRSFALYGDVDGSVDEAGRPVRRHWAADYDGAATVVHGHVVVDEPTCVNNVVNVDTGCVFGGSLTAFRWPENTTVSIPACRRYWTGAPDL